MFTFSSIFLIYGNFFFVFEARPCIQHIMNRILVIATTGYATVLGANDGLISTASLLMGFAAARGTVTPCC